MVEILELNIHRILRTPREISMESEEVVSEAAYRSLAKMMNLRTLRLVFSLANTRSWA